LILTMLGEATTTKLHRDRDSQDYFCKHLKMGGLPILTRPDPDVPRCSDTSAA